MIDLLAPEASRQPGAQIMGLDCLDPCKYIEGVRLCFDPSP